MRFIDVFAGCGGLSLGLLKAGGTGVFAIEKNAMAFETLRHNLIQGERFQFDWPDWLPVAPTSCEDFMTSYCQEISRLTGTIDLMVGGPPCQGFSTAGRRNPDDPRNKMAEKYLELVRIIRPTYIVIENVSGFNSKFSELKRLGSLEERYFNQSYADFISASLESMGYSVSRGTVNCSLFGVPQSRRRYLILCSLNKHEDLYKELVLGAERFKSYKGLSIHSSVSAHEALSDLQTHGKQLVDNLDSGIRGFKELGYRPPRQVRGYLALMRDGYKAAPNSMRLPNHKPQTVAQFAKFRSSSEPGKSLSKSVRDQLGLKKHAITVLSKNELAPTVTTLPDDIIHYSENRILTARETARLQSFPDWFEFMGKYTTGGAARKVDCPRYTQIGNAVPPLLSEAIGVMLLSKINERLDFVEGESLEIVGAEVE